MSAITEYVDAILRWVSVNEIGFDQKEDGHTGTATHDDPIGVRLGAFSHPRGKFYIDKVSFDVLSRKDGQVRRDEAGFVKFAIDEFRDGDGDPVPMVELFMTPKAGGSQDGDMQRVATFCRKGIRLHVPVEAAGLSGGSSGHTDGTVTFSQDGRFWFVMQNDGNLVVYRTRAPFDKAQATPIWATGSNQQ